MQLPPHCQRPARDESDGRVTMKAKQKISSDVEAEIRLLCRSSIRGMYPDQRRIYELSRRFPREWKRIHDEEREKAIAEINPLYNK